MPSNINKLGREYKKAPKFVCDLINESNRKYKGMNWAEINFAIQYEEEEERKKEAEKIFQKKDNERKYLYNIGKYELEEGEILE
jgi:hypothetical protein